MTLHQYWRSGRDIQTALRQKETCAMILQAHPQVASGEELEVHEQRVGTQGLGEEIKVMIPNSEGSQSETPRMFIGKF